MKRINIIYPLVIILFFLILPSAFTQNNQIKNVLVINSYHKGFPWTDNIVSGIESVLKSEFNNIELTVEYMDTKSIGYGSEYKKVLYDSYSYKYKNNNFDLIIVSDDNAFNFLREFSTDLFPDIPIVFCGLNNSEAPNLVNPNIFTGILETLSHEATIDLILDLHRETKKIMLIVDTTPSGNYRWNQIEPSLIDYKDIEFTRISDEHSISEIENILGQLPNDTAVIFFTLYRDKSGEYISLKEGVTRITEASSRPVYTTHLLEFPYGVLGGKVLGGFYHGETVANIAVRILNGEEVGNISFIDESPTQYAFNYEQLKKWGIKLSKLPEKSIILNKPVSIYEKYKYQAWGLISFILVLIAIIIALEVNNNKRKQIEEALKKSKRLLSETEKLGKVGGWEINTKTLQQTWTDETYSIHEMDDHSEMTVENGIKFYKPASRPIIEQFVQRAIDYGESFDVDLEIITSKGKNRIVHVIGKPDLNDHRVYGFLQDITDRKNVENQLIESENRFRKAIEQGPFPIIIHAEDGEVLSLSSTWTELSGYTHKEIPTINLWTEKAYGIRKEIVNSDINDLYDLNHRKAEGEYEINCSDGTKRIWDFSSVPIGRLPDNRRIVMSMAADITDHIRIKEDLVASKKRFELSIKSAPIPMVITDANQDIILFNDKFTEMFGYTLEDITTAEQWWNTAYPDKNYRQEIQDLWENAILKAESNGNSIEMIVGDLTIKDRSIRHLEFYMTLLEGFSVIAMIDITNRILDEKEKSKLLEQLNHKSRMDAIGELAGGMAHDFNNVLNGILSASHLLSLPKQGLNQKSLKYVELITQASIRASDLISNLLAFSRKGKISNSTLDVHEILNEVVAILKGTIDKKITISVTENATNHKFIGDLSAIESTFLNLGINASHAMPHGGEINIKTKNIYLDQEYCNASSFEITPGEFLQIEIVDAGYGIPKENLQKIFEPFYTTKEQGKGTGLGLSAVYGTIQNIQGSIEVHSKLGVGTTFSILLPSAKEQTENEKEESPILTGSGTILLVDDEEFNRILNKEILESLGYKVFLAEDGMESIEVFSEKHSEIDIVLMDMIMPKMNGAEAFYKMKEIDENCKIIIGSGYTQDENIEVLKQNGLAGFINKPYKISDISRLLDKIQNEK